MMHDYGSEDQPWSCIQFTLGDPGAASREDAIFSGVSPRMYLVVRVVVTVLTSL